MHEEGMVRRSREARPGRMRRIWGNYRVELIGLLLAGIGLFLLVEQLSLRRTIADWIRRVAAGVLSRFQDLDAELMALLARISLSDVVGTVLILGAAVALLLRLRWRLLRSPSLTSGVCPRCGGSLHRIHRRWYDRVICLYVPVRRYRCHDPACRWQGLRFGRHHVSTRQRSPVGA